MAADMSVSEIKVKIRERGLTLSALGERNGFSHAAVSIALRKRSPFVQQIIADFLGMSPQEIWPSRYDQNGSPLRIDPRGRRSNNPLNGYARQQKRRA